MKPLALRPEAAADVENGYLWYESQRQGLGDEFLAAVQACLDRIAAQPRTYPIVHRDTRRALLQRFPYGLFFRDLDEFVVVVACFHARRDPRRWRIRG